MKVRSEYACVLIYGPVLDDDVIALGDLHHILESLVQEVNLEIERPPFHILIKISEIWIEVNRLELWRPSVLRREHLGQGSLSATDVSSNCYMHNFQ